MKIQYFVIKSQSTGRFYNGSMVQVNEFRNAQMFTVPEAAQDWMTQMMDRQRPWMEDRQPGIEDPRPTVCKVTVLIE